jgi:3-methyladenine DNA glycosylase AlkD
MDNIIEAVRLELISQSDEKTRKSGERFFKEKVNLYGLKSKDVINIGEQNFAKISDKSKANIFNLCEELWKSNIMEESFIACNWAYYVREQFLVSDFDLFERWIGMYVNNWATCDTLCNHTVGYAIEKFNEKTDYLKRWAKSPNRWMRRASVVSLIIPARKGLFLEEIFHLADILLTDKEDMVQKGYGWMLKSASKPYQKEVFEYVCKNKSNMPRTALRYAIEKMPAELKAQAMAK